MKKFLILVVAVSFVLAACQTDGKVAESDSPYSFGGNSAIPTDENIYTITGEVVADVSSLTRQVSPASGSMVGVNGFVSGSYFGAESGGKGFVRILVRQSDSPIAPQGAVVILKMTDTKGVMLLPGDVTTLKCRAQYEAIASIYDGEQFNVERYGTWELDYCRLVSPKVSQD